MKSWLRRLTIPFISAALPFFAVELFIGFLIMNVMNNLEDVRTLLSLNLEIYR